MPLHIYTDKSKVPHGMEIIDFNDTYFDLMTSIPNIDLVKFILKEVDKAEYNSEFTFIGRTKFLGALDKNLLSTGTKTLLNIIQHTDVCFNVIECGVNAKELIPLITDGHILWSYPVLLELLHDDCDIILNGNKHYTKFSELQTDLED